MRIDKWLWATRVFKTRSLATDQCKLGRVTIKGMNVKPSRLIKAGDVIAIREQSKEHVQIKEAAANAPAAPEYLEVDTNKIEGKLVKLPLREQIPVKLEEQLVVEYYSR